MSELSSSTLTEKALFLEEMYPNDLETDLVQECIHFQCHFSSERILVKLDFGSLESLPSFLRKQNLQNVYPNLDIAVRMALCTPATNCSARNKGKDDKLSPGRNLPSQPTSLKLRTTSQNQEKSFKKGLSLMTKPKTNKQLSKANLLSQEELSKSKDCNRNDNSSEIPFKKEEIRGPTVYKSKLSGERSCSKKSLFPKKIFSKLKIKNNSKQSPQSVIFAREMTERVSSKALLSKSKVTNNGTISTSGFLSRFTKSKKENQTTTTSLRKNLCFTKSESKSFFTQSLICFSTPSRSKTDKSEAYSKTVSNEPSKQSSSQMQDLSKTSSVSQPNSKSNTQTDELPLTKTPQSIFCVSKGKAQVDKLPSIGYLSKQNFSKLEKDNRTDKLLSVEMLTSIPKTKSQTSKQFSVDKLSSQSAPFMEKSNARLTGLLASCKKEESESQSHKEASNLSKLGQSTNSKSKRNNLINKETQTSKSFKEQCDKQTLVQGLSDLQSNEQKDKQLSACNLLLRSVDLTKSKEKSETSKSKYKSLSTRQQLEANIAQFLSFMQDQKETQNNNVPSQHISFKSNNDKQIYNWASNTSQSSQLLSSKLKSNKRFKEPASFPVSFKMKTNQLSNKLALVQALVNLKLNNQNEKVFSTYDLPSGLDDPTKQKNETYKAECENPLQTSVAQEMFVFNQKETKNQNKFPPQPMLSKLKNGNQSDEQPLGNNKIFQKVISELKSETLTHAHTSLDKTNIQPQSSISIHLLPEGMFLRFENKNKNDEQASKLKSNNLSSECSKMNKDNNEKIHKKIIVPLLLIPLKDKNGSQVSNQQSSQLTPKLKNNKEKSRRQTNDKLPLQLDPEFRNNKGKNLKHTNNQEASLQCIPEFVSNKNKSGRWTTGQPPLQLIPEFRNKDKNGRRINEQPPLVVVGSESSSQESEQTFDFNSLLQSLLCASFQSTSKPSSFRDEIISTPQSAIGKQLIKDIGKQSSELLTSTVSSRSKDHSLVSNSDSNTRSISNQVLTETTIASQLSPPIKERIRKPANAQSSEASLLSQLFNMVKEKRRKHKTELPSLKENLLQQKLSTSKSKIQADNLLGKTVKHYSEKNLQTSSFTQSKIKNQNEQTSLELYPPTKSEALMVDLPLKRSMMVQSSFSALENNKICKSSQNESSSSTVNSKSLGNQNSFTSYLAKLISTKRKNSSHVPCANKETCLKNDQELPTNFDKQNFLTCFLKRLKSGTKKDNTKQFLTSTSKGEENEKMNNRHDSDLNHFSGLESLSEKDICISPSRKCDEDEYQKDYRLQIECLKVGKKGLKKGSKCSMYRSFKKRKVEDLTRSGLLSITKSKKIPSRSVESQHSTCPFKQNEFSLFNTKKKEQTPQIPCSPIKAEESDISVYVSSSKSSKNDTSQSSSAFSFVKHSKNNATQLSPGLSTKKYYKGSCSRNHLSQLSKSLLSRLTSFHKSDCEDVNNKSNSQAIKALGKKIDKIIKKTCTQSTHNEVLEDYALRNTTLAAITDLQGKIDALEKACRSNTYNMKTFKR